MANRHAQFNTSKGNFKLELFEDKAPVTTGNFIKLAEDGFSITVSFSTALSTGL